MKRFRWIPAALAGGLVLAIVIQIGRFVYHSEYKITEVAVYPSPDGSSQVALQAVGQPDWPFGAAAGRVQFYKIQGKKKVMIEEFSISVSDDGAPIHRESCRVEWQEDRVIITLSGSEQEDEVHTVALISG